MSIFIVVFAFSLPPPQYPPPVFLVASGTKGPRLWGGGARLGTAPLPCTPLLPHLGAEDKGVGDAGRGAWELHARPEPCWGGSRCRGTATGWRDQTSVSEVGRHRSRGVTREIGRGGRTPAPLVPKASRRARRPLHPQPLSAPRSRVENRAWHRAPGRGDFVPPVSRCEPRRPDEGCG